jgi:2-methylcitrate dehydratase
VKIRPAPEFSLLFPAEMPSRVTITLLDGRTFTREKRDYQGFRTRPMQWEIVVSKFEQLSQPCLSPDQQNRIEGAVLDLDHIRIREFTAMLGD